MPILEINRTQTNLVNEINVLGFTNTNNWIEILTRSKIQIQYREL